MKKLWTIHIKINNKDTAIVMQTRAVEVYEVPGGYLAIDDVIIHMPRAATISIYQEGDDVEKILE